MINILPRNIANLIAAGEVINRPASALKELMENSIDAGAKSIQVFIEDAGRTLIQVIDDGCGMSAADAAVCFERHATSKILTAEDLEKIITYGFRGEALASIGAVAQVTLKTRREEDQTGVELEVSDSKIDSTKEVACPKGTNISVRNLFFNVPARRKFLKSDAAEFRHILQDFQRVSIANPAISLSLTHNGKPVHRLRAVPNVKQRIIDLFGASINKELVAIATDTSVIKVSGFIGVPEDARKTLGNQFLFVNGRYFRSPYLHKAVCKPYENLIKEGMTPSYFVFLEIDPTKVDVNIHPSKTEVKFEEEPVIFEIVSASVRESLGRNSFVPSIDFESGEVLDIPVHNSRKDGYVPPPKIDYNPLFNPFETDRGLRKPEEKSVLDHIQSYGSELFEDEKIPRSKSYILLGSKYIALPSSEGLMIISVLRARERLFYNRFFPKLLEQQEITQQSLYPEKIDLSPNDHSLIVENLDMLCSMGFDIRDFGKNSIVVYGLPAGFSSDKKELKEIIDSITASLSDGTLSNDNAAIAALSMARSAALSCRKSVTDEEAQLLIETVLETKDGMMTADGKKCCAVITNEEIERKI
ncbi:MAG: DNA mismatch repair endonuclease MutL [Bacteroidales bacterium]|nr:DNA mismatch repair endonuclease MutL [Bacteroidales bacterium]